MGERIAVAAPNTASTAAARAVAEAGGGAVDAAVAAMLVAMTTEPGVVSLDAGAFVTVWPADADEPGGQPVTVDGCVAMPGLAGPASRQPVDVRIVETGYGGGVTMTVGLGSAATPGALAALGAAQTTYGRLPWREVVAPAVAQARGGFPLGTAAAYYLPYVRDSVLAWDPQTAAALRRDDGGWVGAGDRMVLAGLADTLQLVADEGARTMYVGSLAAVVASDMADRGGLVTAADLASYEPVVRPALPFSCGGWQVRTNPPPAIGGPVLAALLTLLGERPDGPWTEEDVAALVGAQRTVLGYRATTLDLAEDRTAAALALLDAVDQGTFAGALGSPSTVQVSVVDATGGACSVTASSGYGSGATVPGTGLWLNNCLGEHELNRGAPLAPGARLASNMAPTVARRGDGAVLAVGSPGADRITTALAQVLAAFAHGGAGLQAAIDRPRLHVSVDERGRPVVVHAESDLPLPELGVPVRAHEPHSMFFGGVAAALRSPDGTLTAAGDPRRAGATAVSD